MKIGFDLDGVLCNLDIVLLQLCHFLGLDREELAVKEYYRSRIPLLNPNLFLADEDEWYIITARRPDWMADITKKWLEKFCPGYNGLYFVGECGWNVEPYNGDFYAWNRDAAIRKIKIIKELELDLYIDDNPDTVIECRKWLDIPIIKYGARL